MRWLGGISSRSDQMRKFLISVSTIAALGLALLPLWAFPPRSVEMKQLKKNHSKERKTLKQQQRGSNNIMKQHDLDSESKQRFQHNMKMQRQLVKKNQRQETRRLKQQGKAA